MAHKPIQDTFERHFPLWESLVKKPIDILVVHPEDSAIVCPGIARLAVGKAMHTGFDSIVRLRTILEHINGLDYDQFTFFEYDALCIGNLPDITGTEFAANCFMDEGAHRGFKGTMYTHPPLMFTKAGLARLVGFFKTYPMDAENCVWDRWLGYAVQQSGIAWNSFLGINMGFAHNTIHPDQFKGLRDAIIRKGAKMIHGVKTKACFDVIREASEIQRCADAVRKEGGIVHWL